MMFDVIAFALLTLLGARDFHTRHKATVCFAWMFRQRLVSDEILEVGGISNDLEVRRRVEGVVGRRKF